MNRRDSDAQSPELRKARARYELARTLLVGLLVAVVLASLAGILWEGLAIRAAQRQNKALIQSQAAQGHDIKTLLERQAAVDADRQKVIDTAVGRIADEQYRALVAHDTRVAELLHRNLALIGHEVNDPANQERGMTPIPRPRYGPTVPVAPKVVAPRPAPAPRPVPCDTSGRSGRCKK